jgi:LPS O-antigen subunit length determinant protein (WzzB/FepE family)
MNSQKNYQNHNEIDLSKIIISIWNNKFKIFIITAITIIIVIVIENFKEPIKPQYGSEAQIKPITHFDETKYVFYNSYLKIINNKNYFQVRDINQNLLIDKLYAPNFSSSLSISNSFLMNLFIDKLNQKSTYIDAIKKFKLIKKENYSNDLEYETAAIKLASSIKLIPPRENKNKIYWTIHVQNHNKKNIEDFLKFIEKKANQDIRLDLENFFKDRIESEKKLIRYEIEDIEAQISQNLKNFEEAAEYIKDPDKKETYMKEMNKFKIRKIILLSSKYIERFEEIFNDTPITNPEQFYAAKIMVDSLVNQNLNKSESSLSKQLLLASILGLILSMIFIFLTNIIKQKR